MIKSVISSVCVTAVAIAAVGAQNITFGPVRAQPGQKIHLKSQVSGAQGTVEREKDGKVEQGQISFSRSRDLTWTFRAPAADGSLRGMVRIGSMNTDATVTMGGKVEKSEEKSPLNGKLISLSKPASGDWTFELDGSLRTPQIEREVAELTRYLKRNWYPETPVKLGDSWEFDPVWLKSIIEKDLHRAQTIATMRLRQTRHSAAGRYAHIAITIESTGGDLKADGSETAAQLDLKGDVTVNLDTMLDEQLDLSGTLVTRSGTAGEFVTTRVPLQITVTKAFVRD